MKIATCCYCGTRAALVLDRRRHELSCAGCGAPLHNMKALPKPAETAPKPAHVAQPKRQKPAKKRDQTSRPSRKSHRKSKRKPMRRWGKKLFEELWDVVEDVFD
ncbi:MAG: hypothetical protein AB8B82_02780 [Roseovarius sp.]